MNTGENISSRGFFKGCNGCEKRRPGCQDKCGDYLAAKILSEDRREKDRRGRAIDNQAKACKLEALRRTARKKVKER